MSDGGIVRLLVFRIGDLACATEADTVREILPQSPATRIPGAPALVAGLVNVRGSLVTVVDGRRALLGGEGGRGRGRERGETAEGSAPDLVPDAPETATTVLLELGGARRVIGFTVDEVIDLLSVAGETLEPRQALPGINPILVRAVGRRDGRLFVVLDTDALLTPVFAS